MGLRMPRMKEFLFGLSIRTGSIIIAAVCLAGGLLVIIPVLIYGVGAVQETERAMAQERPPRFHTVGGGVVVTDESSALYIKFYISIVVCSGLIQAIVSGLLLAGIIKKIRYLLLPWTILTGISIMLLIISLLYHLIAPAIGNSFSDSSIQKLINAHNYISVVLKLLFSVVLSTYSFCVIYEHFVTLREYQEVNKRQNQG